MLLLAGGLFVSDRAVGDVVTPGVTVLISVSAEGGPSSGISITPSVSADGRFVAFESSAPDLVPGDTNIQADIFVRDVASGVTRLVSVDQSGGEANSSSFSPSISADGQWVAFASSASDLVFDDGNNNQADIFLRNVPSGVTTLVSVDQSGGPANGPSFHPAVSGDGRFVAFNSLASDLVAGDTNSVSDVFIRDVASGATSLVSVNQGGGPANGDSGRVSVSPNGRFVAFEADASNLVPGDTNGASDIFLRDVVSRVTRLVSVDGSGGPANGSSFKPSVSADGRFVAFESLASDLVPGDTNGAVDVFVRDLVSGVTRLASVDGSGGPADSHSSAPSISADGRFVAFHSLGSDLVPGDTNGAGDVFVRDLVSGVTRLVSLDSSAGGSNGVSSNASLSGDGRFVAFESSASDLVPGDSNGFGDVFVRHLECVSRFVDVSSSSVFCDAIAAMSGAGVVRGFSDGTFRPLLTANRQELAAMLYRWSGSPGFTPPATPSFSDVPTSHVFYKEIEWAASRGVVRGFSDGTFRPVRVVTRQELVAMLYRIFGSPPFTPPATPSFSDVPASHVFFREIEWAAARGVASGFSDGTFRPTASLRRQELAAFLTRARWVV
ncbi:MAG: hypothetical protein KatS3mg008_0830 [Acidimicrobiales bacterium]|nr:MAG: hypothetical protein KatS3mg008_0830 [Acidimicrobiales bacterium]